MRDGGNEVKSSFYYAALYTRTNPLCTTGLGARYKKSWSAKLGIAYFCQNFKLEICNQWLLISVDTL